ncbi:hypothetical protein P7K49_027834 [Saguinus oedipus]|uniref:Uncharacterized protein n=1 Tax=Saguinus oedipus TaxID=9490 RepID=A0ABQ9UAS5_SAGOE|nr:hypothetical protein P7K49_027834 [Saguinus oedipus]
MDLAKAPLVLQRGRRLRAERPPAVRNQTPGTRRAPSPDPGHPPGSPQAQTQTQTQTTPPGASPGQTTHRHGRAPNPDFPTGGRASAPDPDPSPGRAPGPDLYPDHPHGRARPLPLPALGRSVPELAGRGSPWWTPWAEELQLLGDPAGGGPSSLSLATLGVERPSCPFSFCTPGLRVVGTAPNGGAGALTPNSCLSGPRAGVPSPVSGEASLTAPTPCAALTFGVGFTGCRPQRMGGLCPSNGTATSPASCSELQDPSLLAGTRSFNESLIYPKILFLSLPHDLGPTPIFSGAQECPRLPQIKCASCGLGEGKNPQAWTVPSSPESFCMPVTDRAFSVRPLLRVSDFLMALVMLALNLGPPGRQGYEEPVGELAGGLAGQILQGTARRAVFYVNVSPLIPRILLPLRLLAAMALQEHALPAV